MRSTFLKQKTKTDKLNKLPNVMDGVRINTQVWLIPNPYN